MTQIRRVNYKEALKWLIVISIFVFLGKMVMDNWGEVKDAPFTLKSIPFIFSILLFVLSYFIQILAWYLITLRLGIALSFPETLASWFYSQLGKYLPGKIWLLLGRFYFYESKGKSRQAISMALYFETAISVMAAGLVFLASLLLFENVEVFRVRGWMGGIVFLFLLSFIFLHPRVLQNLLKRLFRRLHREPITLSISYLDILGVLLIGVVSWIIGGVGFYLFVDSLFAVSPEHILYLTGALAFSCVLGLVALFAPSGLGVREGTLAYLLSFTMPGSVAVVISILSRIWGTLIETGLIGMVYLFSQIRKKAEERKRRG